MSPSAASQEPIEEITEKTEISGSYSYVNAQGGPYTFHDRSLGEFIREKKGASGFGHVLILIEEPFKGSVSIVNGRVLGPFLNKP